MSWNVYAKVAAKSGTALRSVSLLFGLWISRDEKAGAALLGLSCSKASSGTGAWGEENEVCPESACSFRIMLCNSLVPAYRAFQCFISLYSIIGRLVIIKYQNEKLDCSM